MKIISTPTAQTNHFIRASIITTALAMMTACGGDSTTLDDDQLIQILETDTVNSDEDRYRATDANLLSSDENALYLIIGQSNAAGRDTAIDTYGADEPSDQVLLFTDGNSFETAVQPLNKYSGIRKPDADLGVNLGLEFGKDMYDDNGRKVHLVVNARGSAKIATWLPGTTNFDDSAQRIRDAQDACNCLLTGILWHQGEGDTRWTFSTYFDSLRTIISEFRSEFGEVPFVVGQLVHHAEHKEEFNNAIREVDDADFGLDNVDWAPTRNLTTIDEDTHFDAASMRELGKRYAKIMKQLVD